MLKNNVCVTSVFSVTLSDSWLFISKVAYRATLEAL